MEECNNLLDAPSPTTERRMIMKKYHVKSGDGNGYYGVGYESYRQAESLLKISQEHDPQAYIVEEEYHFTNADRIRAMSDEELAENLCDKRLTKEMWLKWLKQPAEGE